MPTISAKVKLPPIKNKASEIRVATESPELLNVVQLFPTTALTVSGEYDTVHRTAVVNDPQNSFTALRERLTQGLPTQISVTYTEATPGTIKEVTDFSFSAIAVVAAAFALPLQTAGISAESTVGSSPAN